MAQIACQQGPPTSRARARGLHGPNRERIRDRICSDAALRCCTPCGCSYRPGGRPLRAAIRVARTHAVPRACHAPANPLNTCNTEGRDRRSRDPRRPHDVEDVRSRQTSKLGLSRVDRADRQKKEKYVNCKVKHANRQRTRGEGDTPRHTKRVRCSANRALRLMKAIRRRRSLQGADRARFRAPVDAWSNNTRKPISDFGTHPIRTEQTRCTSRCTPPTRA